MQGDVYRNADGKEFTVKFVDHNMDGSWVHYIDITTGQEYNCLVEAFKQRFTKVEKLR